MPRPSLSSDRDHDLPGAAGAADPTDVFLPLLIATFCSTMVGILVTAACRSCPGHPVTLAYLGG